MTLTKHSVNNLYYLKIEIKAIKRELEELNNLGSPVVSDMPHVQGVSSPTEKYVCKKLQLEERLNKLLENYITKEKEINNFIEKIEDDETRLIARLRFINNYSWNKIADELSLDGKCVSEFAPRKKIDRYFEKINKK